MRIRKSRIPNRRTGDDVSRGNDTPAGAHLLDLNGFLGTAETAAMNEAEQEPGSLGFAAINPPKRIVSLSQTP
jgi:hypothetical protein